jgi:hypothetical protein
MKRQKSPFHILIEHFVRRLFAPEEEQAPSGMSFGLGGVLAILASPGAFASIFLMNKYSTFLQWLRGVYYNPIQRSPSDEYFFIVLSMTIIGLVMVARWNRLFPDRRDFSNLAVLPIPIRNIFLANFVALLGLAVLFGIDVNVVSALLFPFFVTLSLNSFPAMIHVGVAHAVTVFLSSLFSFFAVFALVGALMLLVPRRIFRSVSVLMRMLLVVILLTEFFSNIFVQLFSGRLPGGAGNSLHWLPSYWFLGIYESVVGIAKPPMVALAGRALLGLAVAVIVSIGAYALCYQRFFIRLPESFDTMGGSRPFFKIRFPELLLAPLFRSQFERGCSSFSLKVLLRSEQHLLFIGAYFGVGLVIVAQSALDNLSKASATALPSSEYLAIPLLIAFFILTGLRFVFDRPAALDANWLFRFAANSPEPEPRSIAKRLMLWATLPWEIAVLLPLSVGRLGWPLAVLHVAAVVALTVLLADILLVFFRKIPFTCAAQLDIKQLLVQMMATIFGVLIIVPGIAGIEHWMLHQPLRFIWLAIPLSAAWFWLARFKRDADTQNPRLIFQDGPGPPFELLKLT